MWRREGLGASSSPEAGDGRRSYGGRATGDATDCAESSLRTAAATPATEREAKSHAARDHEGTAVAEERQRNSRDRHEVHGHPDVLPHVGQQQAQDAEYHEATVGIRRAAGDPAAG
jgi:hypothetical protein